MRYYNSYGPMANQTGGAFHLISFGIFVLFLIVIALIVARVVKHHGGSWWQRRDAIDIAKERYARGDIDKAQFDQIKKDLQ